MGINGRSLIWFIAGLIVVVFRIEFQVVQILEQRLIDFDILNLIAGGQQEFQIGVVQCGVAHEQLSAGQFFVVGELLPFRRDAHFLFEIISPR